MKLFKALWKDKAIRISIIVIISVVLLFIINTKLSSNNESGEHPVKIINGCEYEITNQGKRLHKNNCHNPIHQYADSLSSDIIKSF